MGVAPGPGSGKKALAGRPAPREVITQGTLASAALRPSLEWILPPTSRWPCPLWVITGRCTCFALMSEEGSEADTDDAASMSLKCQKQTFHSVCSQCQKRPIMRPCLLGLPISDQVQIYCWAPGHIRSDNGPEFRCDSERCRASKNIIALSFERRSVSNPDLDDCESVKIPVA